jgi:hypothetical protein
MKTIAVGLALLAAAPAFAQNTLETSNVPPLDASEPMFDDGSLDDAQPIQQPNTQAPNETPQLPANIPPPPGSNQQAVQNGASVPANGQWVFTQQYGWVYAPYDQTYTYVTDDVSAASMYAYRPTIGWAWIASPWVISVGPRPYWGTWGPYRYAYYSHPWFRVRPHYGSVHYYGRPNYYYHAAPPPRAHYYYRGPGWRGPAGGGGWHHGGGGHHR